MSSFIAATINYIAPTDRVPEFLNIDERLTKLPLVASAFEIKDASRSGRSEARDREGFALVADATSLPDPAADNAPLDIYRAELQQFLLQLTGADDVRMEKFSPSGG